MPRPVKCRKVCHYPQEIEFVPGRNEEEKEPVILYVDEYETIRLMDKEGYSQEECSVSMQIARTTVQRIYENARRKLADCIVEGRPLRIEGGDYVICDGRNRDCRNKTCYKQVCQQRYATEKGDEIMRIAVTYENGEVFQHFGHTQQFKVYDIRDNKVCGTGIMDTYGQGHGALAGVLMALQADMLICGGIGGGAQAALAAAGIKLYAGVSGSADAAVEAFLNGKLEFNTAATCNHHHGEDHHCGHHHEDGHECGHHHDGDHHCGNHGCGSGHCGDK